MGLCGNRDGEGSPTRAATMSATATMPEFKVGQFYSYAIKDSWCREGVAEVTEYGVRDTYWGNHDATPLSEGERASAVLLFDSADYEELDRYSSSSKHLWEKYHPDDRKKTTEQHGCYTRWFVKKGAKPDIGTRIENARVRLAEARDELKSAQWRFESRTQELEELEKSKPCA